MFSNGKYSVEFECNWLMCEKCGNAKQYHQATVLAPSRQPRGCLRPHLV